jgi:hypothetical protein
MPIIPCPDFDPHRGVYERPVMQDDYVLKQTHQRRILIPGIPEMYLYNALTKQPSVSDTRLYPGVDRYDLRVKFKSGIIHGIDVKDHRQSYSLEKILGRANAHPTIDTHEGLDLGYDFFYYLLPDARVAHFGNGLKSLNKLAQNHKNLRVMTIGAYIKEIENV